MPPSVRLTSIQHALSLLGECEDCLEMLRADPLEIVSTYRPVGGVTILELLDLYLKQVQWTAQKLNQILTTESSKSKKRDNSWARKLYESALRTPIKSREDENLTELLALATAVKNAVAGENKKNFKL